MYAIHGSNATTACAWWNKPPKTIAAKDTPSTIELDLTDLKEPKRYDAIIATAGMKCITSSILILQTLKF